MFYRAVDPQETRLEVKDNLKIKFVGGFMDF